MMSALARTADVVRRKDKLEKCRYLAGCLLNYSARKPRNTVSRLTESRNIISNFLRQKGPLAIVAVDAAASGEPRNGRADRQSADLGCVQSHFQKIPVPASPKSARRAE